MGDPRIYCFDIAFSGFRISAAIFTCTHADDGEALDQRHVGIDGGNAAAGETDDQQAAIPIDTAHGLIKYVAANGILDHIRTLAAGQFFDLLAEAVRDIDDVICAALFDDFEFFI